MFPRKYNLLSNFLKYVETDLRNNFFWGYIWTVLANDIIYIWTYFVLDHLFFIKCYFSNKMDLEGYSLSHILSFLAAQSIPKNTKS